MRPRFTFGQYVHCRARCHTRWDVHHKIKTLIREEHEFSGWICGATRRFEGTYNPGGTYGGGYFSDEPPECDPATLIPTKSHFLWKVSKALMAKPLEVLDDDLEGAEPTLDAPLKLGQGWPGTGWTAEDQRREMQNWPRNSKGQWIKKSKEQS